jgi:hypothetical protein
MWVTCLLLLQSPNLKLHRFILEEVQQLLRRVVPRDNLLKIIGRVDGVMDFIRRQNLTKVLQIITEGTARETYILAQQLEPDLRCF